MTSVKPPPINQPLITDESGIAALEWILFFDSIFKGDSGVTWTPQFTNLTEVGVAAFTGVVYKISRSLAYFRVTVLPATSTSSTAGTTYINNFPLVLSADGACDAVSGLLGALPGMCEQASNRIYVPAWSAVTVPVTITGTVEAS